MTERPLVEVAEAVFEGGCRWLMLREKDLDSAALAALAGEIVELAKPYGAHVIVNRDFIAGADGIHLPQGCSVTEAQKLAVDGALVGVSTHSLQEAMRAADHAVDYVTLSPIYPTSSKPGYGPALGLDVLRHVADSIPTPVIALGGVTADNAASCLEAGAAGVAVMGAVMKAEDPEVAVAGLLERLKSARTTGSRGG